MLTLSLVLWPMLCAGLFLLLPAERGKSIAIVFSFVELVLAFIAFRSLNAVDNESAGLLVFAIPWSSLLGSTFAFSLDGVSALLVLLAALVYPLALVTLREAQTPRFFALFFLLQAALVGVFTARDGLLFYVFWELALIPAYFLCFLWGSGEGRWRTTLRFFIYTLIGSLAMLVALVYIYLHTPIPHSFAWDVLASTARTLPDNVQGVLFWALFLAFAVKMPLVPVHSWQPDIYAGASTPVTIALSALMAKMGAFGLLYWLLPFVPQAFAAYGDIATSLCIASLLYASLVALAQKDIKRLIAYSSLAHMGMIAAGICSRSQAGVEGAALQMFSHGVNVAGLFLIAEYLQRSTGTLELSRMGGLKATHRGLATAFFIIAMGSVALPLTNGFVGEFLMLAGLAKISLWFAASAGLAVILGALYMLRAYQQTMLGPLHSPSQRSVALTLSDKAVFTVLCLFVVVVGVYPSPLLSACSKALAALPILP